MIKSDFHTHTYFSGDSSTPMVDMMKRADELGLSYMCFTEHMDLDFPLTDKDPAGLFEVDTDAYHKEYKALTNKSENFKTRFLFGVELGLQPHLADTYSKYVNEYPFDFVIGSSHICNGKDPYYSDFYEGRSEAEAYTEYFESIVANIKAFDSFDVYGHLDYVVRYGPNRNLFYTYDRYSDIIDAILKLLIEKGKGIEVNTSALGDKYHLGEPHPCREIIKKYRELGGEIITIGSDAHTTDGISLKFSETCDILKDCGYKYYSIFQNRKCDFIPIE